MPLPASGPISMSQVAAEFDSEVGANFSLSASAANLPTPVASNIFLAASFYGKSFLTSFAYAGGSGREEAETACEDNGNRSTAYHNGSSAYPVANDVVYTNSSGTTFVGANAYKMGSGNVMIVGANGVVSEIFTECE